MKNILITGATDGIGLETSKLLAKLGHNLTVHGRNAKKLDRTREQLEAINPNIKVRTFLADLSDFSQVTTLISEIKKYHHSLDILINNAGIFKTSQPISADGLDMRFVVNTISPYILTKELFPLLAGNGRIVNLSSAAQAPLNIDALSGRVQITDDFQAYAQSKLAITIWSQKLAKELKPKQVIVAVNPGSLLASKMVKEGFGLAGNDLNIGADILVRASLSDEFSDSSGKYFDNDSKTFSTPHIEAENTEKCEQLMTVLQTYLDKFG